MSDVILDQVVELAFKLSVAEQAKLLERVAGHLAQEVAPSVAESEEQREWTDGELAELLKPGHPKSGSEIAAMLESGDLDMSAWSEMMNPDMSDSVEWVKALRRDMTQRRNLNWGKE